MVFSCVSGMMRFHVALVVLHHCVSFVFQVWPSGLRGFLYLIGLLWTFIGVAPWICEFAGRRKTVIDEGNQVTI